jgi:hypothetical protein
MVRHQIYTCALALWFSLRASRTAAVRQAFDESFSDDVGSIFYQTCPFKSILWSI